MKEELSSKAWSPPEDLLLAQELHNTCATNMVSPKGGSLQGNQGLFN